MNAIQEVYELETVEQMRAIADDLRQRMFEALTEQAMTATQVGARLGIPATRAHYHVRELERVGLLRMVETREKGGILEKYFRPIARNLVIPPSLIRKDRAAGLAAVADFVQDTLHRLLTALSRADRETTSPRGFTVTRTHLWMTTGELQSLAEQQQTLFEPYLQPRGIEGEIQLTLATVVYPTELGEGAEALEDEGEQDLRRVTVAGLLSYDKHEMERFREEHKRLNMTVYGKCTFTPDVPPWLVDEVIARFRVHGQLEATDEVRAVLKTKEW